MKYLIIVLMLTYSCKQDSNTTSNQNSGSYHESEQVQQLSSEKSEKEILISQITEVLVKEGALEFGLTREKIKERLNTLSVEELRSTIEEESNDGQSVSNNHGNKTDSLQEDCLLETPINLSGIDLFDKKGLVIRDITLNKEPLFTDPNEYLSGIHTLNLSIFPITAFGVQGENLGVRIDNNDNLQRIGFDPGRNADKYSGGTKKVDGRETHFFEMLNKYSYSEVIAKTRSEIVIENDQIISIKLRYPVYKVVSRETGHRVVQFEKYNDDVCVLQAN